MFHGKLVKQEGITYAFASYLSPLTWEQAGTSATEDSYLLLHPTPHRCPVETWTGALLIIRMQRIWRTTEDSQDFAQKIV